MLEQDDTFYKNLPFTLSQEQSKPAFVIFGTGLQQCLIAAHYSKVQNKVGLILDFDRTYGSCLKTITIKQLFALNNHKQKINMYEFLKLQNFKQKNQQFQQQVITNKQHRGYSIDLQPNFFFGSSITCDMLKQADMDKYMDFRLVYNMLHYDGKNFKHVPLSKGKIFESKDLSLLQKKLLLNTFHNLTQIYNKHMNIIQDQNSTKQFDKQFGQVDQKLYNQFIQQKDQHFYKFVSKLTKNNQKIMNYIVYILCNYQHNYKQQLPQHIKSQYKLIQLINRFGKFVKSCGVYSQCPYLYVDNGIGDVPQAYSRIASIYLSTYILHPCIQINSIEQNTQNNTIKIYTNLYPNNYIQTKQILYGPTCYNLIYKNQQQYNKQYTLRVMFLCQKLGKQQDCPSIIYLLDLKNNQNPVYMFMLDCVSHTCPQKYIFYQFQTVINNNNNKNQQQIHKKINTYIQVLKHSRGQNLQNSIKYVSAYIRQKRYPKNKINYQNNNQKILRDHIGIDLDSHFINFKEVVGQQPLYFKKSVNQKIHQDEEWHGEDQTVGLIQRLHAIDINKQQTPEEQQQEQQGEQQKNQIQKQEENKGQQKTKKEEQTKQVESKEQHKQGVTTQKETPNNQQKQLEKSEKIAQIVQITPENINIPQINSNQTVAAAPQQNQSVDPAIKSQNTQIISQQIKQ